MEKACPCVKVLEADLVIVNASFIKKNCISLPFMSVVKKRSSPGSLRGKIHLQRFQPFFSITGRSMCQLSILYSLYYIYSSVLPNINFKDVKCCIWENLWRAIC